jgi:hypothetical protein
MLGVNPGDHDRSRGYLQIDGFRTENRLSSGKEHNNVRVAKDCSACGERGKRGRIGQRSDFATMLNQRERRCSKAA